MVENAVDKCWISIARGRFIYFSANSRLTTPPINLKVFLPVNIKTSSTYLSPSSHVTLHVISAPHCKISVVSSGIGGDYCRLRISWTYGFSRCHSSVCNVWLWQHLHVVVFSYHFCHESKTALNELVFLLIIFVTFLQDKYQFLLSCQPRVTVTQYYVYNC